MSDRAITRDDVITHFNAFLGRIPEDEHVIQLFMRCESTIELARVLSASREFSLRMGTAQSISSVYNLLYGGVLDGAEAVRLAHHGVVSDVMTTQTIRRIIGATDRQVRSTPFLVRFAPEDVTYIQLDSFELAIDVADVAVGAIIMRERGYEPHLTSFFQRSIKPGMTVVDVGANIGYYSMLAASLVGVNGKVIAIEPNSENARLVLLSAHRNNFRQINLIPVALSTKTGNAFFLPHMGSNGGLLPSTEAALSDSQCVVVPTIRMDELVPGPVDFIKVDTEGAEGLILEGASKIIECDRPIISSEFSPEMLSRVSGVNPIEFLSTFKRRGYRVIELDRDSGGSHEMEIADVEHFMRDYGDIRRISELVFMP